MDKTGKSKFAHACVQACNQMCPDGALLVPEMNFARIVQDEEHVHQLFWYYNSDDGFERDEELVTELVETGQLEVRCKTVGDVLSCSATSLVLYF